MIGVSVGAHYRILTSSHKIKVFLKYLSTKNINVIELSVYDKKTYDLFFKAYLNSSFLKKNESQKIHLHLPRKEWSKIGLKKIVRDVNILDKKLNIKLFVVHYSDFVKHGNTLTRYKQKIGVENDFTMNVDLKIEKSIVCDINHFWEKNEFHKKDLVKFIKNNYKQIKEFHFAHKNHNFFNKRNIQWLKDIHEEILKISNFNKVPFVFEGTNKKTNDIKTLIDDLDYNLLLISSIICKN